MNTEMIQLKGVVKSFGKNIVLDDVSLSIPEGQVTGIVGASGEGKTTILKLLIGFYKPQKGEVLYLRRSVYKDVKEINNRFGFSTEEGSFYENLTIEENVYHFGRLYEIKRNELKERVDELIKFVGLDYAKKTKARYLSQGMKKRLDLACSLVHKPEVIIMDEPTADLDPLLRDQVLKLIKEIKKSGTTIVLTTQLMEEMEQVCDKVAILFDKKIIEEGSPGKIRKKYKSKTLDEAFRKIFSKKRGLEKKESSKDNPEEKEKGAGAEEETGWKKELEETYGRPAIREDEE